MTRQKDVPPACKSFIFSCGLSVFEVLHFNTCICDLMIFAEPILEFKVQVTSVLIKDQKRVTAVALDNSTRCFLVILDLVAQVDNIITVTDSWNYDDVQYTINNYKKEINHKTLFVRILLSER